jgi:hypothetical protein
MKKFSEFIVEEQENLNEGIITGLIGLAAGIASTVAAVISAPLVVPVTTGIMIMGIIETISSVINDGKDGNITLNIKDNIEKFKNKRIAKNLTQAEAEKILKDVEDMKSKLSGARKGAITKLQNELEVAFRNEDDAKVGKIIKNFVKRLEDN